MLLRFLPVISVLRNRTVFPIRSILRNRSGHASRCILPRSAAWLFVCTFLPWLSSTASPASHAPRDGAAVVRTAGLSTLRFVENRGQFGREGALATARYVAWSDGVYLFIMPDKLQYVFTRMDAGAGPVSEATGRTTADPTHPVSETREFIERLRNAVVTQDVITVHFDGADPAAMVEAASPVDAQFNYYLPSCPRGITGVPSHRRIAIRGLYAGIDLEMDASGGTLKTAFVVRPGANASDIRIRYSGSGSPTLAADGSLEVFSPLGYLRESHPETYVAAPESAAGTPALTDGAAGGDPIPSTYQIEDDVVRFSLGSHDPDRTLIIDPQILWGTYYGGTSSEIGNDVKMAGAQPMITGMTTSVQGIATAGTYQTTFTGPSSDAFLAQFDANGVLVWGTYFGGTSYEGSKSLAIDGSGMIAITGFTASTAGVASAGAWQTAYAGGPQDTFIAMFAPGGALMWSTYFGGPGYEDGNAITFDRTGNIVVTGWTSSTSGISTSGTHQFAMAGGDDAFIAKFSASGSRIWGTYLGGRGSDWGEGIAVNSLNNIIVVGRTNSASGISASVVQQPAYGGGPFYGDGYIATFTPSGARLWGTYVGGAGDDWAADVAVNVLDDILITGYTESPTFISSKGTHQPDLAGVEDAFVAQYGPTGQRRWGSYVGGAGQDRGRGIAVVDSSYVMITGFTKSGGGIATPGAAQTTYAGGQEGDAFVVELTTSGIRVCGTYFGGPSGDVGTRIATDFQGYMYITGYTLSQSGIATPGSWKDQFGGMQDVFFAKYDLCLKSNVTELTVHDVARGPYCAGDSILIPFSVRGAFDASNVFTAYLSDVSGSFNNPTFLNNLAGTGSGVIRAQIPIDAAYGTRYRVRVVASTPYQESADNGEDITIYDKPIAELDPSYPVYICPGKSTKLHANTGPGYTYKWMHNGSLIPGATARELTVSADGLYSVVVTNPHGCSTESMLTTVTISLPPARAGDSRTICQGASTVIGDPPPGAVARYVFSWTPADGLNSTTLPQPTASPDRTTMYYLTMTDTSGCAGYDSVRVTVNPPIVFSLGPDRTLCAGTSLELSPDIRSGQGPYEIIWEPTIGLSNPKDMKPRAFPPVSTQYILRLRDAAGCEGADTVFIRVFPTTEPLVVASGPTSFCDGDSVRLTAEAGYSSYRWSTGDTTRTIMVKLTGNYFVTVIDRNGCSVLSRPVSVLRRTLAPPNVTAWPSTTICPGDSAVLTVEGMYRAYRWNTGARTRSIVVRQSGTFQVEVLDTSGCTTGSFPVSVYISPMPSPRIAGTRAVCRNSLEVYDVVNPSVADRMWTITGGTIVSGQGSPRLTVQWGAGTSGRIILTENFPNFPCRASDTLVVTIDTTFVPAVHLAGDPDLCDGDSLVLSVGPSIRSAIWSTGDTARTITVRRGGRYTVAAVDAGGCSGVSAPVDVTVHPLPTAAINGDTVICTGSAKRFAVASAPNASYLWRSARGGIAGDSTQASAELVWATAGPDTLLVTVTDTLSGCAVTAEFPVRISDTPVPRITASRTSPICRGESVVLRAMPAGSAWIWSTGDTADSIVVDSSGIYTLEARNADGCTAVAAPFVLTVTDPPVAIISGAHAACTSTTTEHRISLTAGDAVAWTTTGGTMLSAPGDTILRMRWDAIGVWPVIAEVRRGVCVSRDTLMIDVGDQLHPSVSASGPTTVCAGDSVELIGDEGHDSYLWSTGDTTRVLIVRTAGSYTLRVSMANGCSGVSDPVIVNIAPRPAPVIAGPDSFCEGDTVTLVVAGAWRDVTWSTGAHGSSLRVSASALVRATVTDTNGCTGVSAEHAVVMNPRPAPPVISRTGPVLTSTPAAAWQWILDGADIPGATGQSHTGAAAGVYRVRITDAYGCMAVSDTVSIPPADEALATVALPDLIAAPGDTVRIPLVLRSSRNLTEARPASLTARIVFDASTLAPTDPALAGSLRGRDRVIDISAPWLSTQDTLATLVLRATLGTMERTPLRIESFDWQGAAVRTSLVDGSLTLIVCREGGVRLFDGSGVLSLRQNHPNPFNASTDIEFETIEQGRVTLSVRDMAGRIVATLIDDELSAGAYRIPFDASSLASGAYMAVLQTGSAVKTRLMFLMK